MKMVMYEMIKLLEASVGENVRLQFHDERGDFNFDGKIIGLEGDKRILVFQHNSIEQKRMNCSYTKLNLDAIVVRAIDFLEIPTVEKKRQVKKDSFGRIPCPNCGQHIWMVDLSDKPFKDTPSEELDKLE